MKTAILTALAAGLLIFGTGCGNVCDDAADICGGEGDADTEGECEGAAECAAQCIVDADSCDLTVCADTDPPELCTCIADCV